MKITIKEIAELAGVSKATVSRVLNNSKPVSDDVRQRVLEVIENTNFKPNAVARSLSLSKTHLIGMILPDLANPVFSRIISGIESYLRAHDYSLLITATDFDVEMKIRHINILKEKGVDGLILVTDHGDEAFQKELANFGKPVVMIGTESSVESIPVVQIDNYKAASEATQYLVDLGHKRIGMIRGPLSDPYAGKMRFDAYKSVLEPLGLFCPERVVEGWYSFDEGYSGMTALIKRSPIPTAVFCSSDLMAIGAMKCALDQGYQVPDEIAFIGFDDVQIAKMYNPALTTVRQPFEEKGRIAIHRLIDMIEHKQKTPQDRFITLSHRLIIRQSTEK
ncbi:substrate-binding domain-containing protein [Fusibacter tunisiensis]|uniref:LacI family transcriptional regulator n=1 Tax=Fusibacter tunisiensis TaxID=1008308 RepID=A0ABS2MQK0_9FIRM|nr:LacI family transcriptional regulator [Fusibacter tunisiensis]